MAGTTGLEPATSAVTGQRSNQLSYVPRLFFNNLDICHIESSGSQLSLFSTISSLWTQSWVSVDTTWTPRWTPKLPPRRQDQVYQKRPVWHQRFTEVSAKVVPARKRPQRASLPDWQSKAAWQAIR